MHFVVVRAKLPIYLFCVLGSPWTSGFTLSLLRAASLNWQSPLGKKNPEGQLISQEFCLLSCSLSSFSHLPYVEVCMSSLCTKYTCANTDTHTRTPFLHVAGSLWSCSIHLTCISTCRVKPSPPLHLKLFHPPSYSLPTGFFLSTCHNLCSFLCWHANPPSFPTKAQAAFAHCWSGT